VAVAAALNLTEPMSTGIGGDMFALFWDNKAKKVRALNGSGRAAASATLEGIREALGLKEGDSGSIPIPNVHAATVPGAAAGWVDTVEKFGSGKLTMEQILAPAIRLAEEGFPVSELTADSWQRSETLLKRSSENFGEVLKPDRNAKDGYRAPAAGEIIRNPYLGKTFRVLAKEGSKGFYTGEIGKNIVSAVQAKGGFLTIDDLKHHYEVGTEEVDPITVRFKGQNVGRADRGQGDGSINAHFDDEHGGVDVWECPPNGQGIVALMTLAIFEKLEKDGKVRRFEQKDHNSAE
jgi:gamma-glutamyltranspeptidase/glutathione hydrolase